MSIWSEETERQRKEILERVLNKKKEPEPAPRPDPVKKYVCKAPKRR